MLLCKPDVCIIELGGTLGDIESMPFVEALRQLQDRYSLCLVRVCNWPTKYIPCGAVEAGQADLDTLRFSSCCRIFFYWVLAMRDSAKRN